MHVCGTCEDVVLDKGDSFCPGCGALALPIALSFSPSSGSVAPREGVKLIARFEHDAAVGLDDLRVAVINVAAENEVVEDIELAVLCAASSDGCTLNTLTRLGQPGSSPLSVAAK